MPSIIAIDGPAGSGKSTVSYHLAEHLGYLFIDTGVFYRSITLLALREKISMDNTQQLEQMTRAAKISIRPEPQDESRQYSVWIKGEDVSDSLRTSEVERYVSKVAAVSEVRAALLDHQRNAAAQGHVIMAGRDIGTVVLPNADAKFYVDASLTERARRRYLQKQQEGETVDLAEIEQSLRERDRVDSQRAISPLRQADDAVYILTDGKSIQEVVQELVSRLEAWPNG